MTRLTAMTIGAAMIGFCGFIADSATAQTPSPCPNHEAVVYFAPDSATLNSQQNFAVVSMAEAARTCGAKGVLIHANGNGDRARAVATALSQRGVKATIVAQPALGLSGDTMVARSITLRVATQTGTSS
jgi:hypothetical protein